MRAQEKTIDKAPLTGSNATMTGQYDLNREVAIAAWSIDRNHVTYEKADSHTLSLYLKGGNSSHRSDMPGRFGHAGALSLMPQGHASTWHIGGPIDFVHLYFSDAVLKRFAADHYARDVRSIEPRDLTYANDAQLAALMTAYVGHCSDKSPYQATFSDHLLFEILDHLIQRYNGFEVADSPLKGGLTQKQMKEVQDLIAAKLAEKLSLSDLAVEAGLSAFHFARQFKESFGETPGQYLTRKRIDRVKEGLAKDISLAELAVSTGFSQQSHMTAQFRRQMGMTPSLYRQKLAG